MDEKYEYDNRHINKNKKGGINLNKKCSRSANFFRES